MNRYRKKPVVIDAFRLGVDHIPDWFMDAVTANEVILHGTSNGFDHVADTNADIHTLEGWHHANYGDYIIRGVKGEIYPCKADIFNMIYDVVEPQNNADRIRAMTDEELAQILIHYNAERDVFVADDMMAYFDWDSAVNAELEWLKQPVDGELT